MAMLSRGSHGESVERLQTALNRAGGNLNVDGIFGTKTEQAVRNFQEDNGLPVTGIANDATIDALSPYMVDMTVLRDALENCLIAIENLPEYRRIEAILYGGN